jgi:hypothetical protein
MAWSLANRGAVGFDTVMSDQTPISGIEYDQANLQFPQYSFVQASLPYTAPFPVENQIQSELHAGIRPYFGREEPHWMDSRAQPQGTSVTSATNLATCTLASNHGHRRRACNAQLPATYQAVAHHLRTAHDVPQVKLTGTLLAGQPLLTCPDETCRCRYRAGPCAGPRHPTHVKDLVRHCMDKHLEGAERSSCGTCGYRFTRPESRRRHLRIGCPQVSTKSCCSVFSTDPGTGIIRSHDLVASPSYSSTYFLASHIPPGTVSCSMLICALFPIRHALISQHVSRAIPHSLIFFSLFLPDI